MNDKKITIIGAGPTGLTMALCLANKNIPVRLIDKKTKISKASKAICFARHNLELFSLLGIYEKIKSKGVSWDNLSIFYKDKEVVSENINNYSDGQFPAYLNLQQYYLEQYLLEKTLNEPLIDLCLGYELIAIDKKENSNILTAKGPKGNSTFESKYVIAADGVYSPTREMLNLPFKGDVFKDKFLIVDFKYTEKEISSRRWFWFDSHFNPGKATLLLKQPNNMWRADFQLGWNADEEKEKSDCNIIQRLSDLSLFTDSVKILWKSIYTFSCRRMEKFRYDNVFFIGDAAHQLSPFGARGANSGLQDAKNLAEKFSEAEKNQKKDEILTLYSEERVKAADENIKQSSFSTDFISPQTQAEKILRNTILANGNKLEHSKMMINTGRLAMPEVFKGKNALHDTLYHILANLYRFKTQTEINQININIILNLIEQLSNIDKSLHIIKSIIKQMKMEGA